MLRKIQKKKRPIKIQYANKHNKDVTVHTGIQERGDEDCDKQGI